MAAAWQTIRPVSRAPAPPLRSGSTTSRRPTSPSSRCIRGVTAGSMRGYGTLQTMTALEALVDEIATALPLDPIEFRRRNALKPGGRTITGTPYIVSVRTQEVLDKLENHPIWRDRAEEKKKARPGTVIGTGVACVTKDYGTGGDCSQSAVEFDTEGRITI